MAGPDLLDAAVGFARVRLTRLVDNGAQGLLAAVAPGAKVGAALVSDVDSDLARARAEVARIGPDAAAVGHLAAAVGAVADACRRIAAAVPQAGTSEQALATAVRPIAGDVGGLPAQLGLAGPWQWSVSGTELRAELRHDPPVELAELLTLTHAVFTVRFDWGAARFTVELAADVTVELAGDALVRVLAGGAAEAGARVVVTFDSEQGLTVGGGTQRRTRLPATLDNPAVSLRELTLGVLGQGSSPFEITAELAGSLGPVSVVVSGAGVRVGLDLAAATPLTAMPRDPAGAGVSVNAGLVRGGGQLTYRGGGTYAGTLALTVGPVQARAVGFIGTSPDFSLVLLISSEFASPIQLSFGFTLNAVGGLLAVGRTVSSDAMIAGIHDGTADALLFPDDPDRVDTGRLEAVFPLRSGSVAVGPAFKLGWGTPISFLIAKVGVIMVLPDPKLVVLGALRVALPRPELPIIDLRASVYGELTPERVLVLVSLAESRLAGFGLTGDLGMLFAYGAKPRFAISAGGFHPGYQAPAELSRMRRLAVDLSPPTLLSLRAEAYAAITSNAFMLGARVEASLDFGVADAHGYLAFDAIVLWAPFHFEVDIRAGVAVRVLGETIAGVRLSLHLEGPGRWVAHGTATVEFVFLPDLDIEVGPTSWGTEADPPPSTASPLQLLRDELAEPRSWQVVPPGGADQLVTLRDAAPGPSGAVFAHPLGGIGVRQRAVPLGEHLDQIGGHPVSEHLLALDVPVVGAGIRPQRVDPLTGLFPPGLFFTFTDEQKLSTPAFASYQCGFTAVGFHGTPYGPLRESAYQWETVYPHQPALARGPQTGSGIPAWAMRHVLDVSPVGRYRATVANPYRVAGEPLRMAGAP